MVLEASLNYLWNRGKRGSGIAGPTSPPRQNATPAQPPPPQPPPPSRPATRESLFAARIAQLYSMCRDAAKDKSAACEVVDLGGEMGKMTIQSGAVRITIVPQPSIGRRGHQVVMDGQNLQAHHYFGEVAVYRGTTDSSSFGLPDCLVTNCWTELESCEPEWLNPFRPPEGCGDADWYDVGLPLAVIDRPWKPVDRKSVKAWLDDGNVRMPTCRACRTRGCVDAQCPNRCSSCGGSGRGERKPCSRCEGKGSEYRCDLCRDQRFFVHSCKDCKGTGHPIACTKCFRGTGKLSLPCKDCGGDPFNLRSWLPRLSSPRGSLGVHCAWTLPFKDMSQIALEDLIPRVSFRYPEHRSLECFLASDQEIQLVHGYFDRYNEFTDTLHLWRIDQDRYVGMLVQESSVDPEEFQKACGPFDFFQPSHSGSRS